MRRKKSALLIMGAIAIMSLSTACGVEDVLPEQAESASVAEDESAADASDAGTEDEAGTEQESADAGEGADIGSDDADTEDGADPESSDADTDEDADAEEDRPDLSGRANADTGEGEVKILEEGDIAPDFTAELSNGGSFKLSDYDDKTVLINFWASWCGPCVGEMPAFEMLKNDNIEDLEIVCINCMEDKGTVDQFVAENGYTFNIGYDVDGRVESYYPTEGIPYTLVVKKGVISNIFVGAMDADYQYKEYKNAIGE